AGSLSETYKRNALNNGYLVLAAPGLVDHLKERLGSERLTVRPGLVIKVDFKAAQVELDGQQYRIGAVGAAAQELILAGGLEDWVKEQGVG
ncbi:MAG: homoaconitase, partial [Candidatus Marinimicrobia bacterium]|nr:homoaconitase [Candidatus Neomarinimicrobiota bacterium]